MRTSFTAFGAIAVFAASLTVHAQSGNSPGSGFTTVIGSAMRYAMSYEPRPNVRRFLKTPVDR